MIRTLLFDLGNVLVNFSHERMCRQIGALVGRSGEEVHAAIFDGRLQLPLERGEIDQAEFQRRLEARLKVRFDPAELERASCDIFSPNAFVRPLLDQLRHQGYRLVALTNTSPSHYEWVRSRYDVFGPFHSVLTSFAVGAVKPEEAIYRRALREIQCAPAECFYTDDIAEYVAVGRRFGLQAEVFTDAATLLRQLRERGIRVG
jgi:HAD superfamily hydrolase (TIGR01509 family)